MKNTIKKTRRPNGEGCYYYYNGYWCCKKRIIDNGERKRKTIYAKTRIELMQKYISTFGTVKDDLVYNQTFSEYILYWLLNIKKITISSTTLENNLSLVNKYIKPFFCEMQLSSVQSDVLIEFFNNLLEREVSANMFNKCKFLLNQFFSFLKLRDNSFNYPYILNSIKYNKRNIGLPKYKAIPKEIRKDFIEALENNKLLKVICCLGLYAGMRIGEILSLTWENVDLDNRIIKIKQSLSQNIKFDKMGKVLGREKIISYTKTECSARVIPIPEILHKLLVEWKNERYLLNQIKGNYAIKYVIGDDKIKSYSSAKKQLNHFSDKYNFGMYNIHFHTMRHTYATMLLEQSVNPKIVQFLLGHKSVKTTLEIYNNIENSPSQWILILNNVFNLV